MRVIGREPAQLLAVISALIQLASALFLHLTVEQQGALNAVASALLGVVCAFLVSSEKGAPLLAGLLQALIACALAFGVHLTPELQSSAMALVVAAVAMWLRTQVVAPVPMAVGE